MKQISLCLTNYNRFDMLVESFEKVKDDDRISEIIISDDHSDMEIFESVMMLEGGKLKVFRNEKNVDCYTNKMLSVQRATNDYCIVFDSDNTIDKTYLDALYSHDWHPDTIMAPDFAKPAFDYAGLSGKQLNKSNISQYVNVPHFSPCINCMNYFVHRDSYLEVWQPGINPYAADTILQNYNWLKSGRSIFVVPGMQYWHRIHDESHFKANVRHSRLFHAQLEEKIKNNVWEDVK
jgi:glycosyltransferase involved in cell wall biosynthesis